MQEQVRLLIEREVRYAQVGGVERARRWRSLLAGRFRSLIRGKGMTATMSGL